MKINVEKLKKIKGKKEAISISETILPGDFGYDDFVFTSPLGIRGWVENIGEKILVVGDITATVKLTCSRCLDEYSETVETSFEQAYSNKAEELSSDDADEIHFFSGDEIELTEDVMRTVFLELPMQPLCGPDCAGLCNSCGANLNKEACSCDRRKVDIRMEKLRGLLDSLEKGVE